MSVEFTGDSNFRSPITYIGMYSDGTPMVKTDQWAEIVNSSNAMVLRADSLSEFMVGMFLVDAVNDSVIGGVAIETLILPYLPGARQDRSNPTGDVLFTAKSVANEINVRRFDRVISVDPHSPVMPKLINNFVEYPLEEIALSLGKAYSGIIAPDKGAKNRALRMALAMGLSVYYGSKVRNVESGKLTGFALGQIPKGHYLVVDDICDGGGTFIGLGEKIREQGATADLFVTHGIFSKGTHALKEIYNEVYTTNTRNIAADQRTQVKVLDVVAEMENYNE